MTDEISFARNRSANEIPGRTAFERNSVRAVSQRGVFAVIGIESEIIADNFIVFAQISNDNSDFQVSADKICFAKLTAADNVAVGGLNNNAVCIRNRRESEYIQSDDIVQNEIYPPLDNRQ